MLGVHVSPTRTAMPTPVARSRGQGMIIPPILVGQSLGQTIYRCTVALLVLLAIGWSLWSIGSRAYNVMRAAYWKDAALEARDAAVQAPANPARPNAGPAHPSDTRHPPDPDRTHVEKGKSEQSS